MQLYFIRHAQSQNNALWIETGSSDGRMSDPELSEYGRDQAKLLAKYLSSAVPHIPQDQKGCQENSGFGITHVYSSLMVRALETASILAEPLKLTVNGWKDLHESGGVYEQNKETLERIGLPGNSRSFLLKRFPGLVLPESVDEKGWWNRPFEEREERLPRAQNFLKELLEKHGGTPDKVVVVSHFGFYNYFMRILLKTPDETDMVFVLNNCGITRVDFDEDFKRLVYTNRTDFLPLDYFSR